MEGNGTKNDVGWHIRSITARHVPRHGDVGNSSINGGFKIMPELNTNTQLQVELKADPNPDAIDYRRSLRIKESRHDVRSFVDASRLCRDFIEVNELGAGNWTGGRVFRNGKQIARVSYNGRVWDLQDKEIAI
jgi:hypothetical protein